MIQLFGAKNTPTVSDTDVKIWPSTFSTPIFKSYLGLAFPVKALGDQKPPATFDAYGIRWYYAESVQGARIQGELMGDVAVYYSRKEL